MNWLSDAALERLRRTADQPPVCGDRYEIIEPIGQGGMGAVYLAEDRELRRSVAVKVLKSVRSDGLAGDRMIREAQVIARLEHPGIVPVHDVGVLDDGRIYYVMKLVRGRRLDEHFADDASLTDRLRVFERICETIAFAHSHGVIHRDLKPQNIMVGAFGEVLVLDWGLAKLLRQPAEAEAKSAQSAQSAQSARCEYASTAVDSASNAAELDPDRTQTRRTEHGTVVGTPSYMSPEQGRGEVDGLDARSDVYSLGAILYYLLTGTPPKTTEDRRSAPASDDRQIESPRSSDPSLPRALDAICMKALAENAADRYTGADELSADVSRYLSERSVTAYREGPLERAARVIWKYRTPLLLVAAYLVVRLVLIFFRSPQ